MVDRSIAPAFKKVRKVDLQKAISGNLVNGIPLHIIDAGSQPVIKLEMVLYSGKWFEPEDGISYFTTKMLTEGTANKTSLQVSEFFDRYGAYVELNSGFDYNTVALYVMIKHFPETIKVFREILTEASFPEEEFQILKNNTLNDLRVKNEKINILATKKFRETIFGNEYPYGKEISEENVVQLGPVDKLKEYYKNHFFNKVEIVASGNIFDDQIELINDQFGSFESKTFTDALHPLPMYKPSKEVLVREKSSQSSIRIGKRLFNKNHPDYLKMLVVNEVLGGYFGSRLMKNIREEKGYTYGVYSRVMSFKKEGYFSVSLDVKKEDTRNAIDEIYKEIKTLQQEPVPEEEMETVRNEMIGGFLSEINSPFALADKFKAVHFQGLDYQFYQNFIDVINTITPEEVMEAAVRYLDVSDMSEVVVGGVDESER
jgi:zinc protease